MSSDSPTPSSPSSSSSSPSPSPSSPLDPLALLRSDLSQDDYEGVISAINRLIPVALALGPARTRNELIPFLIEFSETDNDEAQTAVAKQLGDFADFIGGPSYLYVVLALLEKLCGEEEFVVRDQSVQSLNAILTKLPKADIHNKFIPMLKRLANGDWFTTRVSACGLFAASYSQCPEAIQAELRSLFNSLCNDDTPMVRKAAFQNLGKFALSLQRQYFKSDIYPIVKAISIDDMDSMRIFAIDSCSALSKVIDASEYSSVILPIIEALQDDSSWRVRQQLAIQFVELAQNQPAEVGKKLMATYSKLLRDKESEVRVAAAEKMETVVNVVKVGLLESLAPILDAMAADPVQAVRVAFSRSVVGLCPAFGKDTSGKVLVPIIQQLTKDEYYEVRNNIISRLDLLSDAIGAAGISNNILPSLIDLAKDPKWRVRMGVIEKCHLLAQQMGAKTFEKKLQPVIIGALSDHVYAIREVACAQVGLIVKEFGGRWGAEKLFPSTFSIYDKTTNYLHRMTCLQVIDKCAEACGPHHSPNGGMEVIEKSLMPIITQSAADDVANVRIAAAKTMDAIAAMLQANKDGGEGKKWAQSKFQPLLSKLSADADADVAYFAQVALNKL